MTEALKLVEVAEKYIQLDDCGKNFVLGVMQGIMLEQHKQKKMKKTNIKKTMKGT